MFPPFSSALFWNTLFDKGLLACIVLLLGYRMNRFLERFRSQQALASEGAKIRLQRIGVLWEELNLWESDAKQQFIRFCSVTLRELRAANVPGVPPKPNDDSIESSPRVLSGLLEVRIPAEVQARVYAELNEKTAELAERAAEISRQIERNRFWLPKDVYLVMRKHHLDMLRASQTLTFDPGGLEAGKKAFRELEQTRQDLDNAVERLLGGSRSP